MTDTSVMYDSANPEAIPSDAQTVGAYVNGYTWTKADYERFAHAVKLLISVEMDSAEMWHYANFFDIENGALTPELARECIIWRQKNGKRPNGVYFSESNREWVQDVMHGVAYYEWAADWTGRAHLLDGTAATQYESNASWDASLITRDLRRALWKGNIPWPPVDR